VNDDYEGVVKGEDIQAGDRRRENGRMKEQLQTKQSIVTGDGLGDQGRRKRSENRWGIENVVAAETS